MVAARTLVRSLTAVMSAAGAGAEGRGVRRETRCPAACAGAEGRGFRRGARRAAPAGGERGVLAPRVRVLPAAASSVRPPRGVRD